MPRIEGPLIPHDIAHKLSELGAEEDRTYVRKFELSPEGRERKEPIFIEYNREEETGRMIPTAITFPSDLNTTLSPTLGFVPLESKRLPGEEGA